MCEDFLKRLFKLEFKLKKLGDLISLNLLRLDDDLLLRLDELNSRNFLCLDTKPSFFTAVKEFSLNILRNLE